ncbi:uncharacterized protein A1O9_06941 [Exophiala aquamarina CBS 119918]|uniref:Uncharacterized protein n=1 Tax=Exophiala aquamarina CBS 119918 TaxID=1182545 RepID=A0A072PA77_9EURO|nr:uncharacterized protein A1O9_06941 [Exophiala aquamarina CBS 119918]KEF56751.1 hypothetical protein A1O9_06941 [Exophiala aquamarina CBS 119918]
MNCPEKAYCAPGGQIYYYTGDLTNCTISACPIETTVYGYRPSIAASSVLIALYTVCLLVQFVYGWRYKAWWFAVSMILGCICEVLGYAGRIMMWQNPWGRPGFIMQIVLITVAPVFFSAAVYVLLAQIVQYISVEASRFKPTLFYIVFIPCDVISLILQAVGGAMSSTSNGKSTAGVNIALAGLSFQVATLVLFVGWTVDYIARSRHVWRFAQIPGRFVVFAVFLTLALLTIMIRCCYRVYELNEGYSRESEALRDQPLFIGLESVMIIVAAYALILAHPGPAFRQTLSVQQTAKWEIAPQEISFDTVPQGSLDPRQRDALLRDGEPTERKGT